MLQHVVLLRINESVGIFSCVCIKTGEIISMCDVSNDERCKANLIQCSTDLSVVSTGLPAVPNVKVIELGNLRRFIAFDNIPPHTELFV